VEKIQIIARKSRPNFGTVSMHTN